MGFESCSCIASGGPLGIGLWRPPERAMPTFFDISEVAMSAPVGECLRSFGFDTYCPPHGEIGQAVVRNKWLKTMGTP